MRDAALPAPEPGLIDRALGLRDRLVADPRFQAFAQSFPLTRFIARRRAKALFDLSAGFVYSQALLACLRLDLFETLLDGPLADEAIAAKIGLPPEPARRLLEAAVALRLLERRRGGRVGLGPLGSALLGNPAAAAMIRHHPLLYADLADPVACLAGGRGGGELARYWAYAGTGTPDGLPAEAVAGYSDLMAASQPLVSRQVLNAYRLAGHRVLMDVAGGSGAFLAGAAPRAPNLKLVLFDLPAVTEAARARFAAAGLSDRATIHAGNFKTDSLPRGADLISLVRVLHDHDDAAALALLESVRAALEPGGTLLVAEPLRETRGAETLGAYFAFYLHALGSGRLRSAAELDGLLRRAGFGRIRHPSTAMPILTSVLTAQARWTGRSVK